VSDNPHFSSNTNLVPDREKIGNRIRLHPFKIHIKNKYEYGYLYNDFIKYPDNSDIQTFESMPT
jgi:hypothetical protein